MSYYTCRVQHVVSYFIIIIVVTAIQSAQLYTTTKDIIKHECLPYGGKIFLQKPIQRENESLGGLHAYISQPPLKSISKHKNLTLV